MKTDNRHYLLVLLTIIFAFNGVDRIALGILLQSIKIDLNLSDTQLGVLGGIAFALFYSTMGVPIARWADRGNRVGIIAITTSLWSVAVAFCGAATSFLQLLIVRVFVAIGEAGCVPPAHSLIADRFSRTERPRAVARYMLGVSLGVTIGYFGAGWLNELYGWRTTFIILGIPGIVLAILVLCTLREPARHEANGSLAGGDAGGANAEAGRNPSFREVCVTLWANRSYRHLLICFSVWNFFGYGMLQWTPAFFIRSYGLSTGELGSWFAIIYGGVGAVAIFLGGEWSGRHAAGDERLQLRVCAASFVIFPIIKAYAFLAPNYHLALAALAIAQISNLTQGPMLSTMQTLVAPRMRAVSVAIVYLFSNLIGLGLGPLFAGILSDALASWAGNHSLRYALCILCPGYFWAAWHLWRASQSVLRDVSTVQSRAAHALRPEPIRHVERRAAAASSPLKRGGV